MPEDTTYDAAWLEARLKDWGVAYRGPQSYSGGQRFRLAVCPFSPDHTGTSVACGFNGGFWFKCQHNGCADNHWPEFRKHFEPNWQPGASATVASAPDTDAEDVPVTLAAIPTFPIDILPKAAQELVKGTTLRTNLVVGAILAALMCAIGGAVDIRITASWIERLIVWVADLAPRGAGKTPSIMLAFGPLFALDAARHDDHRGRMEEWRQRPKKERGPRPRNLAVIRRDSTMSAIYRRLERVPDTALVYDELGKLLRGLIQGEYKATAASAGSVDADGDRLMELWNATAASYTRVGRGAGDDNEIDLYIPRPTLTIVGPLQDFRHYLLGDDQSGLRPRWLPHVDRLATADELAGGLRDPSAEVLKAWQELLERLWQRRQMPRVWVLTAEAKQALDTIRQQWAQRARDPDCPPSLAAALDKGATYLVRIASALAEADLERVPGQPATPDELPFDPPSEPPELALDESYLERARQWMEFTFGCWLALGERSGFALTYQDRMADPVVAAIAAYVETNGETTERDGQPRRRLMRRALLNLKVGGVKSGKDMDVVLERYLACFPGDVDKGAAATGGGPKPTWVYAPRRAAVVVGTRARTHTPPRAYPHNKQASAVTQNGSPELEIENETAPQATEAAVELTVETPSDNPVSSTESGGLVELTAKISRTNWVDEELVRHQRRAEWESRDRLYQRLLAQQNALVDDPPLAPSAPSDNGVSQQATLFDDLPVAPTKTRKSKPSDEWTGEMVIP